MDVLGSLLKMKAGNNFNFVVTDRYSKLTLEIPTKKVTATDVPHIFVGDWVILYGIPDRPQLDNGPQLFDKIFYAVCAELGTKLLTTTAYYSKTNGKTERYSKTILS